MKNLQLTKTLFLSFIIVFGLATNAQTDDWNVPIGGNQGRNGLSQHLGPLPEQGVEPDLYWSGGEYGKYSLHPVLEGDKLIVSRRWNSNPQGESWIVCYDVYDGTELWKVTLPADPNANNYGKVTGVNDGLVYTTRAGGYYEPSFIWALDINTGDVIWESQDKTDEYRTETINFNSNGDLILGKDDKILCISKTDGTTLWQITRNSWDDAHRSVTVHGNKGYYWDKPTATFDMIVSVCDVDTGQFLYHGPPVSNASMQAQQMLITVGPDGTIYAPRSNNIPEFDYVWSFTDDGTQLIANWSHPTDFMTFGNIGVGPDGSVYVINTNQEIERLDPTDGSVLNTSDPIFFGATNSSTPSISIGADGVLYVSAEENVDYYFYILTADLQTLYSENYNGVRGVAIGFKVIALCGKGTDIRAYVGRDPLSVSEHNSIENISIYPNPTSDFINITTDFEQNQGEITINIFDVTGKIVYNSTIKSITNNSFNIDISNLENGIYSLKFVTNDKNYFTKIIKQ